MKYRKRSIIHKIIKSINNLILETKSPYRKGLIGYFNLSIEDLHFPLMALVDYLGFRLIAMSLLPINKNTIVYGSSDGGITMYNTNPTLAEKMKLSAKLLNLKSHKVNFFFCNFF